MFKHGLILGHYSTNLTEIAFREGFSHYCDDVINFDYFRSCFTEKNSLRVTEKYIEELIVEKGIDIVFISMPIGGALLDPLFINKLSSSVKILMVFTDLELYFESIDRYYAQAADMVLCLGSPAYSEMLKLYGVNAYQAYSLYDSRIFMDRKINRDIDVLFVGDMTRPNRLEYIEYLKDNGIDVQSYGYKSANGLVSNEKMIELYNRSKITINFSGTHNNSGDALYTKNINHKVPQLKGRVTEASMCGSLVLTEDDGSDLRYSVGEHLDTFLNKTELLDKVRRYLGDDDLRARIAENGKLFSIDNYDNYTVFSRIMEQVMRLERKEKEILLDDEFRSVYADTHYQLLLRMLVLGKYKSAYDELVYLWKNGRRPRLLHYLGRFVRQQFMAFVAGNINVMLLQRKLKSNDVDSFVIYGGGGHTEILLSRMFRNKTIFRKIAGIYDQNSSLSGKDIRGIKVTNALDVFDNSHHILISSLDFEIEIQEFLENRFPDKNIITIYGVREMKRPLLCGSIIR